jgi:hypothetical protein
MLAGTKTAKGRVVNVVYIWKRGRVVEGSSLENCQGFTPFVSSNLTASANPSRPITPI